MRRYLAAFGLTLVVVGFTGTALADKGGNPTAPGRQAQPAAPPATPPAQSGRPVKSDKVAPGQAKRQAAAPAAQSAPAAKPEPAHGNSANAPGRAKKPAAPAAPTSKPAHGKSAEAPGRTGGTTHPRHNVPAAAAGLPLSGAGDSGPHKVTICHKTGSATNSYVMITVDVHALKNGHTTAKGDIIPAPAGGCPTAQAKQQPSSSAAAIECGSTTTTVTPAGKEERGHAYGEDRRGEDKKKSKSKTVVAQAQQPTGAVNCSSIGAVPVANAAASKTAATAGKPAASGVKGVTYSKTQTRVAASKPAAGVLGAQATRSKPAGGVLGAVHTIGRTAVHGNLPFTGLPLWIAALVGIALLGTGLLVRRRGET